MSKRPVSMLTPALLRAFEGQAEKIAKSIQGMSAKDLTRRPGPRAGAGAWSTIELIAHLTDTEQVYADRIKRTIAMDTPLVLAFHEDLYVSRLNYQKRDVQEELALLRATRAQTSRILHAVDAAAWRRVAVHDKAGTKTLHDWVETLVVHFDYHTDFISRKRRALGV